MDQQSSSLHGNQDPQRDSDTPVTTTRRRRHVWVWFVVLLAFAGLFYWVITHQQKSSAAAAGGGRRQVGGIIPVTTAKAHSGSVGIYVDAIGTVTPMYTDAITSQVTGVVIAVHYREGQQVKKGDPLIDIDPRPFEATLQQAQGSLERDQNVLAEAQMDLERYKQAWAKNAIPRQTLEDQDKLVLQQQGTVKNDEGTVKFDEVQLSYCHIVSPIDGKVGLRLVDPGNLVTANSTTTLVVVTQQQPTTVVFTMAEDSLPQVLEQTHGGKMLRVDTYDRTQQGHLATGKLTSIDNQIDTTTGTVKLRAQFDNKNGILYPNQFVNTRLLVKTLENQTLVPSSAIQHNGNQDFVYVLMLNSTGKLATSEEECGAPQGGAPQGESPSGNQHPSGGGQHKSGDNQPPSGSKGGNAPQGGSAQHAGPALCKVEIINVKSGVSDNGETAVQGLNPGVVVANSSFEKLQNTSEVSISKVKLPSSSDTSASSAP